MHMLVMKNIANNTMYIVQDYTLFYKHSMELHLMELYLMKLHRKFHYKAFHFHSYPFSTLTIFII